MGNYFYTQSNENIQEKDEESEEIDKKYEKELINNFLNISTFFGMILTIQMISIISKNIFLMFFL